MPRRREPDPLITTKLHRPAVDPAWVPRPRLLARLDEGLRTRVTLLAAPAGFGKSTLAAQWLARQERPVAWLSLDAADSDPERFVRYLVAAVEGATPHRCPKTAARSPGARPADQMVARSPLE